MIHFYKQGIFTPGYDANRVVAMVMTDKELISELKKDRDDNAAIDDACFDRLKRLAKDYGNDGMIAKELLDIVGRILDF